MSDNLYIVLYDWIIHYYILFNPISIKNIKFNNGLVPGLLCMDYEELLPASLCPHLHGQPRPPRPGPGQSGDEARPGEDPPPPTNKCISSP